MKEEQRLTSTHIQSYKVVGNGDISEINRSSIPSKFQLLFSPEIIQVSHSGTDILRLVRLPLSASKQINKVLPHHPSYPKHEHEKEKKKENQRPKLSWLSFYDDCTLSFNQDINWFLEQLGLNSNFLLNTLNCVGKIG